jgi:ABC-type multidrug transport system fused ATPase/permease subunit
MEAERTVPAGRIRLVFGLRHRRASPVDPAFLLWWLGGLLGAGLMAGGMWLFVRRLSGSLQSPLSAIELVTLAVAAVLSAIACRLLLLVSPVRQGRRPLHRDALQWTPTVGLVLIAAAVMVPGSPVAAAVFFWAAIVAEEIAAARLSQRFSRGRADSVMRAALGCFARRPLRRRLATIENSAPPGEICQTLTRHHTADGREIVHGVLRVSFAAGQRTVIEHLAFCPLLCATPQISATAVDELDCSVRVTHVYRYGARLEVKLSEPCELSMQVLVRFRALASRG